MRAARRPFIERFLKNVGRDHGRMALVTDRRAQSALYAATGAMLVGLVWIGLVGTGGLVVSDGTFLVGFALVSTILLGVNLWLGWKALVPLWRTARGRPDDDAYVASGPYSRKRRGLRR